MYELARAGTRDRARSERLGLAPPVAAASGVYLLPAPRGEGDGTVVLQESAVACAFVEEVLAVTRHLERRARTRARAPSHAPAERRLAVSW